MKTIKVINLMRAWEVLGETLKNHPNLVVNKGGSFNFRGDYYIHIYDLFLKTRTSRAPGLFLDHLGYSPKGSKVRNLMVKYLDPELTNRWIDFIVRVMNESPEVAGDILLNTKHQGKREMPGGCINSLIYRGAPTPLLTVISRSIEMPTKGAADVLLISAICQLLCDRLQIRRIPIHWFITSVWTRTRTANYYIIYKYPEPVIWANPNFQAYSQRGWEKYYLTDYEFSYSANKRAKQLFLDKKAGRLTSVLDEKFFYQKLEEYIK